MKVMRILFIIYGLLVYSIGFCQGAKRFTFQKIGWTIELPNDFLVLDSSGSKAYLDSGVNMLDSLGDVKVDANKTIVLIVANKNDNNFNAIITPFNPKIDGSWMKQHEELKTMTYNLLKEAVPGAKIDSSSSKVAIDQVIFEKFAITSSIGGKVVAGVIGLSKLYKGYDFGITYSYNDESVKKQIETMLSTSKFKK